MKKIVKPYIAVIFGLLLICSGIYLVKTITGLQGILRTLPYICVGLGCGIFGHGMGEILRWKAIKNHPEVEKQIIIEEQDERNTTIANRAKAKAYDMMIFIFGALMLAFALMGVDIAAVLLLVFAYLFVAGYSIYYRSKYEKEM
jgi:hypothetical protein